jgi:ATP-dependent metalloprotease
MARLLRSLGLAFILVTAVGAFLDEKSLGKGLLMSNPDMKPMMESNTKCARGRLTTRWFDRALV